MLGGVAQTSAQAIGFTAASLTCIPVGYLANWRAERCSALASASPETNAHLLFGQIGSSVQIAAGQRRNTTDGKERETGGLCHCLRVRGKPRPRNQDRAKRLGPAGFGRKTFRLVALACYVGGPA